MRNNSSRLFRFIEGLLLLSVLLTLSPAVAMAAAYPSEPVRLIVPSSPGGADDTIARLLSPQLSARLGKPVIVENHGGAGGIMGTEVGAKAKPDGHTLLMVLGFQTIQPALRNLPFDLVDSFTPIAKMGVGPFVLVVHPSLPANSVKEFIALAKQKPDKLICATAGLGGSAHMGFALFEKLADIKLKIVHFKSGSSSVIDIVGGHSDAVLGTIPTVLTYIKSGKLRVLGNGGEKRSEILPDVPTIAEAGMPGFRLTQWWGILAPAGTPAPIVDRLNTEFKAILALDEIKNWFLSQGAEVAYAGPTELRAFLVEEIAKWKQVVKEANIKLE